MRRKIHRPTESIFADYGDENGGETDTAEQITGTGAEENTEQTTEETETGKNTEQTTEETETGKNTEQTTETETGEIMDADDTEEAEESVWMMYDGTEEQRNRTNRNWMKDFIRMAV